MHEDQVLSFWFEETDPALWWKKDVGFDQQIRQRFSELHASATRGELFAWRARPEGRLAEVLLLDQFSRHLYRDAPGAFAADPMALVLAQEAVREGADQRLPVPQRTFLYMPYMHSESALVHEEAVRLFDQPGLEDNYRFELRHKAIIDRFGRYPHRNAVLGRVSTPEELAFLEQPGSSF